jgi:hypothetical protein
MAEQGFRENFTPWSPGEEGAFQRGMGGQGRNGRFHGGIAEDMFWKESCKYAAVQ